MMGGMTARSLPALALLAAVGCSRQPPSHDPAAASVAVAAPSVPASTTAAPSASPPPAAATSAVAVASAPPAPQPSAAAASVAIGPVRTEAEAVARALPAVDAALRAAYTRSTSSALGGAHPQPFVTEQEGRATRTTAGFTVTWSRHPPAGMEIEAAATVTAAGVVKVVRAEAVFSPD